MNSISNIVQRWFEAPVLQIGEADQEQLFHDTIQQVDAFNAACEEQSYLLDDKISQVCSSIIKKFDQFSIGELEQLAIWVARHSYKGLKSDLEITGAFTPLHFLLSSLIEKIKSCPEILDLINNDLDSNSNHLEYIDLAAYNYIVKKFKNNGILDTPKSFFYFPEEIQTIIFSEMNLDDLLSLNLDFSIFLHKKRQIVILNLFSYH